MSGETYHRGEKWHGADFIARPPCGQARCVDIMVREPGVGVEPGNDATMNEATQMRNMVKGISIGAHADNKTTPNPQSQCL